MNAENIGIGDRCTIPGVYSGTFEVIGSKGSGRNRILTLRNVSNQKEVVEIWAAKCEMGITQKFDSFKKKRLEKETIVNKILNKEKKKK